MSTLLALIVGWCEPDGGRAVFDGDRRDVGTTDWMSVAIVPQVLGLVPELTVRENIAEAMTGGAATSRGDPKSSVNDVLEALDLAEFADRSPTDEPTSHQDAHHVAAVVAALQAAASAGSAVLVATHDDSIIAAATRVIELTAGSRQPAAVRSGRYRGAEELTKCAGHLGTGIVPGQDHVDGRQ